MEITKKEVGKLEAIHLLLSDLTKNASSPELRKRLNKAWKKLPASSRDGE